MTKNAVRLLFAVAALTPAAVMAGPSYNYVEAAYLSVDVDNGPTLDGFGVLGSFAVTENFHLLGSYADVSDSPFTLTSTSLALGYNMPLTRTTDFVARAGWERGEVKVSGLGSESDNGWSAAAGVRSMLTEQFELNAFLSYVDIFDDSDTAVSVGAVYHFTHNVGVSGGVATSSDATGWNVGLRFSF